MGKCVFLVKGCWIDTKSNFLINFRYGTSQFYITISSPPSTTITHTQIHIGLQNKSYNINTINLHHYCNISNTLFICFHCTIIWSCSSYINKITFSSLYPVANQSVVSRTIGCNILKRCGLSNMYFSLIKL